MMAEAGTGEQAHGLHVERNALSMCVVRVLFVGVVGERELGVHLFAERDSDGRLWRRREGGQEDGRVA